MDTVHPGFDSSEVNNMKEVPASPGDYILPPDWLDAIRTNDVPSVRVILHKASAEQKDFLLNGLLPSHIDKDPVSVYKLPDYPLSRPLHAAVVYHSHDVLKLMWKAGVDVFQTDILGNNTIHVLIETASRNISNEDRYVETLDVIKSLFTPAELKNLLLTENTLKLRPLELACFCGCLILARTIFETKNVYLYKEEHIGYTVVQYFDVSDYELYTINPPSRMHVSPLILIAFAETSKLRLQGTQKALKSPPIQAWTRNKSRMNWPYISIWFLFRFFYVTLFFAAMSGNACPMETQQLLNQSNKTIYVNSSIRENSSTNPGNGFIQNEILILAIISTLMLMFDAWDMIMENRLFPKELVNIFRKRNFIVHIYFYRGAQISTCVSMVGLSLCQCIRTLGYIVPTTLDHTFFVFIACGSMWGLLYFLQVVPWMSIYAIAVQRMIQDSVRFFLIFILFFSVFAISFRRILFNDAEECPKGFETIGEATYSTFLVTLNNIKFREYENLDKFSIYVLHFVFVLFIAILLLNFLIATMTSSYADVQRNRYVLVEMQRLTMMVLVQYRFGRLLNYFYRKYQARFFVKYGDRLCVKHVRLQPWNHSLIPHQCKHSRVSVKIRTFLSWWYVWKCSLQTPFYWCLNVIQPLT